MDKPSRFLLFLLTVLVLSVSCSEKDDYLERSVLNGLYSISTPSGSPDARGDWTDGLIRYVEFNGEEINVYYELAFKVKVPVNNALDADSVDEDGNYYRTDKVVSYFKSVDASDKDLLFTCDKDNVITNIFYHQSQLLQYKVKDISQEKIEFEGNNDIVVLSAVTDKSKTDSLKNGKESDYEGIKASACGS